MSITLKKYDEILALKGETATYVAKKLHISKRYIYEIWNGTMTRPLVPHKNRLTTAAITSYLRW